MIFETHAHYDDKRFDEDRDALLCSMPEQGIGTIINVGASFEGCQKSIALAEQYPYIYAAIGIHPENMEDATTEHMDWIRTHAKYKKVVAIGEIGLDYYWEENVTKRQQQKELFAEQLELAKDMQLPVIIHSRDAAADTVEVMQRAQESWQQAAGKYLGVVHCYSYSKELAREFIKMGYYIGVGGVVTFKNAKKLKETVADIGIEHILLETDCPYMAPEPHRGSRNDSTYIPYMVAVIAELTGHTAEEVITVTRENAKQLFGEI